MSEHHEQPQKLNMVETKVQFSFSAISFKTWNSLYKLYWTAEKWKPNQTIIIAEKLVLR